MWRSKKFIVMALLAAIVLVGSIGGVALAQTENEDDSQPEARYSALLDRVCEIYQEKTGDTIDQEVLADAFAEARETRKEMRAGDADGERPFKRFSHGRSGPCGWGSLCAPTE